MQVAVETLSNLERRLKIAVPAEKIKEEMNKRLAQLTKTARIKGFRQGKVPLNVIKMQYGKAVKAEVLGELMRSTFGEAIQQEKLNPAGAPEIKPITKMEEVKLEAGNDFEYEAIFEVYPDITIADVSNLTIEKTSAEVAEQDINNMLENLRKQHAEWKAVTRAAKEGDQVKVDFVGKIDEEKFDGGEGKDVSIELGAGNMLPEFEKNLFNKKAGDQFEFEMTFPEDYHSDVAGKKAAFEITVHNVLEAQLPELNDEFVNKLNVEGGMEGLRKEIRQNMERMLAQTLTEKNKKAVMDKLLEANTIELPKVLVDKEIENLQEEFKQQLMQQAGGHKLPDLPDLPSEHFEEQARRRVSLGLILSELIKQQGIKADDEKIQAKLDTLAANYEKPEELISYYRSNKQVMAQIESVVLEEQVVDYVLANANISENQISYEQATNPQQATSQEEDKS